MTDSTNSTKGAIDPFKTASGKIRKLKAPKPDDKRLTQPRTEAQKAVQFKKGNTASTKFQPGNPGGGKIEQLSRQAQTKLFRGKCAIVVNEVFIEMVTNALYDAVEEKDRKFILEAGRFLVEYAYGRPQLMEDGEELNPQAALNLFVTTDSKMAEAMAANAHHAAQYQSEDPDPVKS